MSVLTYGVLVEVAPGVHRPAIVCTPGDLCAARALEARKAALYTQVELLVANAAAYDLPIPEQLRERASGCRGDLRELEAVRLALEDALLHPA